MTEVKVGDVTFGSVSEGAGRRLLQATERTEDEGVLVDVSIQVDNAC